jgi:hypothetical protein
METVPSHPYNTRRRQFFDQPIHPAAYKLSVTKALKGDKADAAKQAIIEEIQNMLEYKVGHYIHYRDIPQDERVNILRSFMFLKEKYFPDGNFERLKARLVGDGSTQGKHLYDLISSATVALTIVFLLFNIATKYKTHMVTYDIKGAFLNAKFSVNDTSIYLKVGADIASFWTQQDETALPYLNDRGELYIKLDAFIYGLKQSPLKFQLHLAQTLLSIGYKQSIADECLFYKTTKDGFTMLTTHVDDILQISNNEYFIHELKQKLTEVYSSIVFHPKATSYLGMTIARSPDLSEIWLSQKGLTKQVLEHLHDNKISKSPAANHLFETNNQKETSVDRTKYLSLLMSIMYLARLTRPDILLATTFLATKSQQPTQTDWNHLQRILRYLNGTQDYGVHIHCEELVTNAYCDASYGSHQDGSSHSGYIIKLGNSYLHAKSGKQKTGGTSSTDAELIASVDCLKTMVWINDILIELSLKSPTIPKLFQDNTSTIYLIENPTKLKRVKHLMTKLAFARALHRDQQYQVIYIPTDEMVADCLTKPKSSQDYIEHHAKGLGIERTSE